MALTKLTTAERLIRLEEKIRTVEEQMLAFKTDVASAHAQMQLDIGKVLSVVQNGKIHSMRLDEQREELTKLQASYAKKAFNCETRFDDLASFKNRVIGALIALSAIAGGMFSIILHLLDLI